MGTSETNAKAAVNFQRNQGLQEVSAFVFELPSGVRVTVRQPEDPFLDRAYVPGTKISVLVSAKAGAFIKVAGDCWYLYQNDPDPWPSAFHAHHAESKEVLDCNSGVIYDATTRKPVRKYRGKKLKAFLNAVPPRLKARSQMP